MTWRTGVLALGVLSLLASCTSPDPAAPEDNTVAWDIACPDIGASEPAADFDATLPCLSDKSKVRIGTPSEKPMVVTLWATWCQPCRKEAPEINTFHDQVGEEITVLGIDTQDDRDAALAFASDFSLRFSSVFDPDGKILAQAGIRTLPATFLIDTDGSTVATFRDGDLETADLLEATEQHFGVTP